MTIGDLLGLVGVVALIAANALFVLGEFALVAVDRTRVERLAADGDRRAARVLASLRNLSFELSAAQLGITVTSIALGFVGEPVIARLLDALPGVELEPNSAVSVALALSLATAVQMIFGELAPKTWAIARPLGTAKAVVAPFRWFAVVFGPLIGLLNGAANGVLRVFRVEPRHELEAVRSLDELELLIRSSAAEGTLDAAMLPILARGMSFTKKTASDALVPRTSVTALAEGSTVADLVHTSRETGHSRFPVCREGLDDVVGVVHVKDAARVSRAEWPRTSVAGLATEAPVVPESRDLASLFTEMRSAGQQIALVVDEYGGTAGILTIEDILEEIVGEIEDEYDVAALKPLSWGGVHVVAGMIHGEELRELTGFEMPEGDYDTVAGFVLSGLGLIPGEGDRLLHEGWTFEVAVMRGHRIDRVRITPPSDGDRAPEAGGSS